MRFACSWAVQCHFCALSHDLSTESVEKTTHLELNAAIQTPYR